MQHPARIAGHASNHEKELSPAILTGVYTMADTINLVMLICAAVGAMAFGVLAAYGIFRIGFALMRPRTARAAIKVGTELAPE